MANTTRRMVAVSGEIKDGQSVNNASAEPPIAILPNKKERLGDILLRLGLITAEQLEEALQTSRLKNKLLGHVLVQKKMVTAYDLAKTLSIQLNLSLVDLAKYQINNEAIKLVPQAIARKYKVLPIDIIDNSLMLVMENINDIRAIEDISFASQKRIEPLLGSIDEINKAIDRCYSFNLNQIELQKMIIEECEEEKEAITSVEDDPNQVPVIRIINKVLQQAAQRRVTDIHFEPQNNRIMVRLRVDGILQEGESFPRSLHGALMSRLKVLAGMNIAETRRPQDGRFSFDVAGKEYDVRVSCGNTGNGEMAVLRLLSKSDSLMELPSLGFLSDVASKYENLLNLAAGMILIGGPTGSGKTTTLYASINKLNSVERNIITIEDPIEYKYELINQFQVNLKAGVSFATGLRSFMRLDPDIIMVGEIRDSDTARIATQAALTGHLVLSSVHANDAVGIMYRMLDLGVESYMLCSTLAGCIAQRLVRRICPYCKEIYKPSPEEQAFYEIHMGESPHELYHGAGCNLCDQTGYQGRMGVYEILELTDNIKEQILGSSTAAQIRATALNNGMISLVKDGMMKVQSGLTTVAEIMRNIYF